MDQRNEWPAPYKHIERNDFVHRKHKKQKEEDIAVCVCRYDVNDPESACGGSCLNVLTSTECTPGYCPCGTFCKNQKFQKCEYAKSQLFKTEGRGWGLLAAEDVKAGQFVIEYCGEVISCQEAKWRAQRYEVEGLKDAFIISLDAYESIDATRKGSLARFINHSCQPNCETRKWNVLGEVRVGIFAKQDINAGTELAYDYNFEWYGGAKVRCLCGAPSCSGFLGAKSRGFQEATYLWEDGDGRYSIENVPLYDSEEDEPATKILKAIVPAKDELMTDCGSSYLLGVDGMEPILFPQSHPISVEPLNSLPMEMDGLKNEITREDIMYTEDAQQRLTQKSTMISRIRSNSACRNYHIESSPTKHSAFYPNAKSKTNVRRQVNIKSVTDRLASEDARQEIFTYEESRNVAASQLDALYDEIRPVIEEHERDTQDSVPTSVAEKWIEASCNKLKVEFDLYSCIIKNITCTPRRAQNNMEPQGVATENGIKLLENGTVKSEMQGVVSLNASTF